MGRLIHHYQLAIHHSLLETPTQNGNPKARLCGGRHGSVIVGCGLLVEEKLPGEKIGASATVVEGVEAGDDQEPPAQIGLQAHLLKAEIVLGGKAHEFS